MGIIYGVPAFEGCSDGCMGELACCIVFAYYVVVVLRALGRYVCA